MNPAAGSPSWLTPESAANQDLAAHSIDTFHVKSLEVDRLLQPELATGTAAPSTTATGNTPPTVTGRWPRFTIPKQYTVHSAPRQAADPNGDTLTYDWQEYDLGAAHHRGSKHRF